MLAHEIKLSRTSTLLGRIFRQVKRQTKEENFQSLLRLFNGSAIKYLWLRGKFFRLRRKGIRYVLSNHAESWLLSTRDSVISPQLFASGEFDFRKLLRAHSVLGDYQLDTLIDVGAHWGSICIPAVSRGFFERAIAVEADSKNFSLLRANLLINSTEDRISAINAPVGPAESELFERADGGGNTGDHRFLPLSKPVREGDPGPFRTITIDSLGENIQVQNTLLWMDIQGCEGLALSGAKRLLSRGIPVVLEFDATLLQPNGGLDVGFENLAEYAGFFDLGSSLDTIYSMSNLPEFYARSLATGSSFDLLFLKKTGT